MGILIHPIRNDRDHARAMREIEKLWGAKEGTKEAAKLDILATLVEAYEQKTDPFEKPDPIDAILFRLDQMGMTQADLAKILGSRSRASEVLNRRRPLTIGMIVRLRDALGISADVLIGPPGRERQRAGQAA